MKSVHKNHVPIRTCLVCGRKHNKTALLRVALHPVEKTIIPDREQRLEGRGAYVCPGCLPRLRYTKRVQKAFRNEATGLAQNIGG
jgi:predicted RNA-binding protein YlxR (DUF448 family)